MKDILSLVFFVILVASLASCQSQSDDVTDESKDSSFTLNGAGE